MSQNNISPIILAAIGDSQSIGISPHQVAIKTDEKSTKELKSLGAEGSCR